MIRSAATGAPSIARQPLTLQTAGRVARRLFWPQPRASRGAQGRRLALTLLLAVLLSGCRPGPLLTPPPTPEPLIPTPPPPAAFFAPTPTLTPQLPATPVPSTMTPTPQPSATPAASLTLTSSPDATMTATAPAPASGWPADWRQRIGLGVTNGVLTQVNWGEALPGWYLDWKIHLAPTPMRGVEFAQMARVQQGEPRNSAADLQRVAQANPGSIWLIGNEPDVAWQDNSTPQQYVTAYHDLYQLLKAADPTARVAIGGISQVTPLRMRYLQQIWDLYRAQYGADMPVDIWNIHTFVLREERDSWGVGLPPGFEDATDGALWNIEDHNRLDLVEQQVITFRQWMAAHGQRQKSLIVTEYGILMPADYGFAPEVVARYLADSFAYFATARDARLGKPDDDNRLVQRWCWFSTADDTYPTGNLFAWPSLAPTAIFRAYSTLMRTAH